MYPPRVRLGFLDPLVFSSLWVAAAAGALCLAASLAMGTRASLEVLGIVVTGTLVVYNVDRLRDVQRDRATAPGRSAFVERHAAVLAGLAAAAALGSVGFAWALGPVAAVVLGPVLLLGLAHRRLKRLPFAKPVYLAAAWLAVVVGLPLAVAPAARHAGWVGAVLGLALAANAIASSVRDGEGALAGPHPRAALWMARALAALGIGTALAAPPGPRALLWVPALTLLALGPFRVDERYGLVMVDGALLAGAGLAVLVSPA